MGRVLTQLCIRLCSSIDQIAHNLSTNHERLSLVAGCWVSIQPWSWDQPFRLILPLYLTILANQQAVGAVELLNPLTSQCCYCYCYCYWRRSSSVSRLPRETGLHTVVVGRDVPQGEGPPIVTGGTVIRVG